MDCHCKDHLPGEWHDHKDCDCHLHEHPTYTFVVTKVMEEHHGNGTVFISTSFMETMGVTDNDSVEAVGETSCMVKAKPHPNPWVETRMISLDAGTMTKIGARLFGQVKLRKVSCSESESLTLQAPDSSTLSRRHVRALMEKALGTVVDVNDTLTLSTEKGEKMVLPVIGCIPDGPVKISERTRVRLVDQNGDDYVSGSDVTFSDVGGLDDAVRRVKEIVQLPLKHPEIFERLGIDPPKGVLLHGPSGTGKTLIARAVAGETRCYFKAVNGSEVMDKHYGESEAKLRAAFDDACKHAPAIIFIDEIDALAPRRDTVEGEVERRVTAQLLALMDGIEDRGAVVVLAATNLPNNIDPALRRPGRFDREILVGSPDRPGREEILRIHTRTMPLGDLDITELSEKIHGFVGADIRALCQEAAYASLRRTLPGIEDTDDPLTEDFIEALKVETEDFHSAMTRLRPSSARSFHVDLTDAGWDRVAGYRQERAFVEEMALWPLKHLDYLREAGVSHLTGLLITGPSGVGKTLFARTLAKETGFNVIEIRGGELISKYVGESERNVRELFRQAKEMAPTVLIMDGIEAMTSSPYSDARVTDRIITQLVAEMNALSMDKPVFVVAACARAADLPPALRATGRFGSELALRKPLPSDREELFQKFLNTQGSKCECEARRLAEASDGLTGGDIREVCRRVILRAARKALEERGLHPGVFTVTGDDVEKTLDTWRLREGAQ